MSTQNVPDRHLERDGARLRWRLEGSGPAITLLHGWALDLGYWEPLVAMLSGQFTLLRVDRRGFGLSTGSPDARRDVDDLHAVIAAAGIGRTALLGMSQGARLAMRYALRHPGALSALLLDGPPSLDAGPELPMDDFRRGLQAGGPAQLRAQIRQHPLMQLQSRDPQAEALLAGILDRYQGLDLLQPAAPRIDIDVPNLATPTLVMTGHRDTPVRLAAAARFTSLIPKARRVHIAHAGHLALLDEPTQYAAAVAAFCMGHPA
jgi:3-oxoadipate enol-lactonase